MPNQISGINILWGFPGGPSNTLTGFTTFSQLQSLNFDSKADKDEIRDANGNTSAVVFSNHGYTTKLEGYVVGTTVMTTLGGGGATQAHGAITAIPVIGSTLALADLNFTVISDTWMVEGINVSRGNTKAAMMSIDLATYLTNNVP